MRMNSIIYPSCLTSTHTLCCPGNLVEHRILCILCVLLWPMVLKLVILVKSKQLCSITIHDSIPMQQMAPICCWFTIPNWTLMGSWYEVVGLAADTSWWNRINLADVWFLQKLCALMIVKVCCQPGTYSGKTSMNPSLCNNGLYPLLIYH